MPPEPPPYRRVREIFHGAWERPPGERTAYLDGACGGDPVLRAEVESLLTAGAAEQRFMSQSAAHVAGVPAIPGVGAGDPPAIPAFIGRYRVIRLLGEGGMGTAYEAEQENPSRRVAVKTIRPGLGSPTMLRRFAHEARVLGRLRHPGIAQVYEAGVAESGHGGLIRTPFIAMELVIGDTLDGWVRKCCPTRAQRIELLADICDAVQHAHGNGVVHRDLKPGNVLVETAPPPSPQSSPTFSGTSHSAPPPRRSPAAHPKVLDFGVARLVDPSATAGAAPLGSLATDHGTLIGTLAYMSPEQVEGESDEGGPVDARADVYALGVLLFELLTGRLPRATDGKPIAEAARIIRDEEPLRAASIDRTLCGDLDTICAKALERDRTRRYQTSAELATDLRRYLSDEPIIARPATVRYQLRKFARRHRGLVAGLAAAGLALVLGMASTVWYAVVADRERGRALEQQAATRWASYKLSIVAAEEGVMTNPTRAREQLAAAPEELRNWEWRHLLARMERGGSSVEGDVKTTPVGAFTAEGRALAALVRGGRVEVCDVATGERVAAFAAADGEYKSNIAKAKHDLGVRGINLSVDGRVLAIRSDSSVRVFDVQTQEARVEQSFEGLQTLAMGLSRDGSLLGIVLAHRGIAVLNTQTGTLTWAAEFDVANAGYSIVEFSPDHKWLLCSATSGTSPWNYVYDLAGETAGMVAAARAVEETPASAFDPQGKVIVSGSLDGGIRLRDARTLGTIAALHGQFGEVYAFAFSGDGERLAGFIGKGIVNIWNVRTGALERALSPSGPIRQIALDHHGERLLAATNLGVTLLPIEAAGVKVLRGHTKYVYNVCWSPDGSIIASAAWDGTVRLWDAATNRLISVHEVQPGAPLAPVDGIGFTKSGDKLVVLNHDGQVLEINIAPAMTTPPPADPPQTLGITQDQVQSLPTTIVAATAEVGSNEDEFWRRARAGSKRVFTTGGERECTSPHGDLITRSIGDICSIYAVTDPARLLKQFKHVGTVVATAFSPDAKRLVTSAEDRTVRVWDVQTGALLKELRDHQSLVYTLSFSPDGSRLVSGDSDGLIFVWDSQRLEKIVELSGHTSYVHSLAFSPDGSILCSGSGDATVRLWTTTSAVAPAVSPNK